MDEIDKQCNEALDLLREMLRGVPYDSNIICQVLVELAAEYADEKCIYDDLHGRVESAVMRLQPTNGGSHGKHAEH